MNAAADETSCSKATDEGFLALAKANMEEFTGTV
jgi:hypothetical protein